MNDLRKAPGESRGEGKAGHGYRNEVSWDDGKGRQPYGNRTEGGDQPPAAAPEVEAGNAGDASGRNQEDVDAVSEMPGQATRESPRDA
jgi:hypothetical protein